MTDGETIDEVVVTAAQPKARRLRSVAAGLLGLLAIVGLFASTFAVWGHRVLFNEDTIANTVDSAMGDPAVVDVMATYITQQVFQVADVEGRVLAVLPAGLLPLAPGIVGGAQKAVESSMSTLLESDVARNLVVGLVRTSHRSLMRVLEGDGLAAGVTVSDGQVSINMLPLVGLGLQAAQKLGVLTNVSMPELSQDGNPQEQIAALEKTFNLDLADNFGQLVVFKSSAVANAGASLAVAQRMTALVKRAIWLILALTVVLVAATLGVARHRRRALVALGLGGAAAFLLCRILIERVIDKTPYLVANPGSRRAIASTLNEVAGGLLRLVTSMLLVGLITAAISFITGSSARAVAIRTGLGQGNQSLRGIVANHREASALTLVAAGLLVVFVGGLNIVSIIVAVGLCVCGAWALWGNLGPKAEIAPTPVE